MTAILNDHIHDYLEQFQLNGDPLLEEMYTYAREHGMPVLDRQASRFLSVLVQALRPMLAVEIGCNIGVSALHIARALPVEGMLVTFELDDYLSSIARNYLRRAGVFDNVQVMTEDAITMVSAIDDDTIDFAFIDGEKTEYLQYLDLLYPRLRLGGVLTADNLLWGGRVTNEQQTDEETQALKEFNKQLMSHPGFAATILPVGDGMGFAVKTG